MAINFMKNIFEDNIDESTHRKFVRYGKGTFVKEEFKVKVGTKIQIWAGFEYLDPIFKIVAEVVDAPVSVSGKIVSPKKDIKQELAEFGIEPKKVTGKKYTIEEEFSPDRFREFVDKFSDYYLLLKAKSGNNQISAKTSIPKPGKIVEKFISAKFDKKAYDTVKSEFLFDIKDNFKEAIIKHTYQIDDIIVDEGLIETDPARARLEAKRKGKIIRKKTVDGQESTSEHEAEI